MNIFEKMPTQNIKFDKITSITSISAALEMGVLDQGRQVHGWEVKMDGSSDIFLRLTLIYMKCKCESIYVFQLINIYIYI